MSGCLGTLPSLERRLLGLRAGLAGPALSRAAVARRLGISTVRAGALERGGLRSLRGAARTGGCGGSSTVFAAPVSQPSQLAAQGQSGPQLQPPVLLAHAPALVSPRQLPASQAPRQNVPAAPASSAPAGPAAPAEQSRTAGLTAAVAPAAGGDARSGAQAVIVFVGLCFAALLAAGLVAGRQAAHAAATAGKQKPFDWEPFAESALAPPPERVAQPPTPEPAPEPEPARERARVPVAAGPAGQVGNGAAHANGAAATNGASSGGGGQANGAHANGAAEANGSAQRGGVVQSNGNGNGNGSLHANGGANGNGHRPGVAHPAAIAASGLVSLAVSRLVRGRRHAKRQ